MSVAPALLLFLVLHGVFFADVVFEGRTLSASSLTAGLTPHGPVDAPADRPAPHVLDVEGAAWVDEPSPYLAARALAAGETPLWTAGSGLGAPLAANLNSGAGNPLQLPLNLAPSPLHADAFHLARLLLLACATFAFLRELSLTGAAAVLGAALVTYGGYPLAWIVHHPLSTEIFLPLMLLGFERGRQGHASGWRLLAFAAAGSLLGGKLQATLLCFGFVGLWGCARAPARTGGRMGDTVLATLGALALAGALAAFLLVPAIETMARASGLTLGARSQLASFMVSWPSVASLALPELFVAPGHAFADGLLMPSLGVTAVLLAAIGIAARGAPVRHAAVACVGWALVLLLRNVGAFGDLAAELPVLRAILFVKYTFTIVFALAVAAAIGFDALVAGRIGGRVARRVLVVGWLGVATLAASALGATAPATYTAGLVAPTVVSLGLALAVAAWRFHLAGRGVLAAALFVAAVVELYAAAPHAHPARVDPYRPPAYVRFLETAARGRLVADADLAVPLTSAAAGLADARSIDVLTPGASYAFFTRLVSFCDRVIHFTVDPDVALAATAPAADLANVRWIVTRRPLALDDLATRVRRQVGRERTARLLGGMTNLRTTGGPLAIGPVAAGGSERFAFTLPAPFTLDVTAVSEAPELAFGVLVRGAAGIALRTVVEGVASDATGEPVPLPETDAWQEVRVALARAGEPRRVRVRITADAAKSGDVTVSIGDLGFGPGAAAEARLANERAARHATESGAIREAFRDPDLGVVVYENMNVQPRAFRVRHVEPTGSEDAAFSRLGDGFDFRSAALVAKEDLTAVTAALGKAAADADPDRGATVVRAETPSTVTLATDGSSAALLVLADLAFPGWRADVDGHEAPVYVVDGLLRGVVVPPGSHVVTFRYRPTSWLVGIALTVLGVAAVVPYGRVAARLHRGSPT